MESKKKDDRSRVTGQPAPLLWTVNETGLVLNVSRRMVWRLISLGKLETVRLGRAVRIKISSIEALLERGGEK